MIDLAGARPTDDEGPSNNFFTYGWGQKLV